MLNVDQAQVKHLNDMYFFPGHVNNEQYTAQYSQIVISLCLE